MKKATIRTLAGAIAFLLTAPIVASAAPGHTANPVNGRTVSAIETPDGFTPVDPGCHVAFDAVTTGEPRDLGDGTNIVDVDVFGLVDDRCEHEGIVFTEYEGEPLANGGFPLRQTGEYQPTFSSSTLNGAVICQTGAAPVADGEYSRIYTYLSADSEGFSDAGAPWSETWSATADDDCTNLELNRNSLTGGPAAGANDCYITLGTEDFNGSEITFEVMADEACDGIVTVVPEQQGTIVLDEGLHETTVRGTLQAACGDTEQVVFRLEVEDAGSPDGKYEELVYFDTLTDPGSCAGQRTLPAVRVVKTTATDDTLPTPDEPAQARPADDQIVRLYKAVFGREPDAGGFEFWTSQYREGRELTAIVDDFIASDEFVDRYGADPTDAELVDAMYQNVLGRPGETGGVTFWLDRLADGLTVNELLRSFADSPENIDGTGTSLPLTSVQSQILRLYRAVYGRAPDDGGFVFWTEQAASGRSMESIAAAFQAAPEFIDRYGEAPTDAELIDALYRNVLDRAGDAGGVEFWLGKRAEGMTVPQLLLSFADSPENIERTGTRP